MTRIHTKSALVGGALLIAVWLTACSNEPPKAAAKMEAAASARAHAMQQERKAAEEQAADRQELERIPPPSKTLYMGIHTRPSWKNPFLVVGKSTVTLTMMYPDTGPDNSPGANLLRPAAARRREVEVRLPDLPEALTALPPEVWPYGRVIAVEEDPAATRKERPQVRRNLEATMQVLNDMSVETYDWPSNPRR